MSENQKQDGQSNNVKQISTFEDWKKAIQQRLEKLRQRWEEDYLSYEDMKKLHDTRTAYLISSDLLYGKDIESLYTAIEALVGLIEKQFNTTGEIMERISGMEEEAKTFRQDLPKTIPILVKSTLDEWTKEIERERESRIPESVYG